ncbi:STI1 [Candida oxycetoniae]|uniref:STI1 n=1 Tax=Candida oxycetoniae TaxID=497107 RepID=A0AAI9SZ02_9ASCO|nr:STI1 [Candida oxycetoniae]KAI3405387.2 STI1 [Candida oxycetoniae]
MSQDTPTKAEQSSTEKISPSTSSAEAPASAEELKQAGNHEYHLRNFSQSISLYNQAYSLSPNIKYLLNRAAAEYESKDYSACISTCANAIEKARDLNASYQDTAKAFARMAKAKKATGDLGGAIECYEKALTEHRTPTVLGELRQTQKEKREKEEKEYINVDKAEEARVLGREYFLAADYASAVKAYSEMIKRNPHDPRGYVNRAVCLMKMVEYEGAVRDCTKAIEVDPGYIKGYIKKGEALVRLKRYGEAEKVLQLGKQLATTHSNAEHLNESKESGFTDSTVPTNPPPQSNASNLNEIDRLLYQCHTSASPDQVMAILSDPIMQSILQQIKDDPNALKEHMKNEEVRRKIEMLIRGGIIKLQ